MIVCLNCDREMTRSQCNCGGAWLSDEKLAKKASKVRGELVALKWRQRRGTRRKCPECAGDMDTVQLVDVELDRCKPHGVWFDRFELQTVLERAGSLPKPKVHAPEPVAKADKLETTGAVLGFFGLLLDLLD